jgi:hypothetical protein
MISPCELRAIAELLELCGATALRQPTPRPSRMPCRCKKERRRVKRFNPKLPTIEERRAAYIAGRRVLGL